MRSLKDVKNRGYLNVSYLGRRLYEIHDLTVNYDSRFQGVGTTLMRQVCLDADREGVTLRLYPASGDARLSNERLQAWYEKFGFKLEEDDGWWMSRAPRPISPPELHEQTYMLDRGVSP
jgi:ribosomal protein S18 acetylase RimI-like enzyme